MILVEPDWVRAVGEDPWLSRVYDWWIAEEVVLYDEVGLTFLDNCLETAVFGGEPGHHLEEVTYVLSDISNVANCAPHVLVEPADHPVVFGL